MIFARIITSQWIYWHLEPLEERIVIINIFPDRLYSGPDSGENAEQSQNNNGASTKECRLYQSSSYAHPRSNAKHRYGALILYPICKVKSVSNFVFLCVLETF